MVTTVLYVYRVYSSSTNFVRIVTISCLHNFFLKIKNWLMEIKSIVFDMDSLQKIDLEIR